MANLLNQEEIDNILTNIASGKYSSIEKINNSDDIFKEVLFNFCRRNMLSNERFELTKFVFHQFNLHLEKCLSNFFNLDIKVSFEQNCIKKNELTFEEFIRSSDMMKSFISIVQLVPENKILIIDVKASTAKFFTSLFWGSKNISNDSKQITDFQKEFCKLFIDFIVKSLDWVWEKYTKDKHVPIGYINQISGLYTLARYVPLSLTDMVTFWDIRIEYNDNKFPVCICLPVRCFHEVDENVVPSVSESENIISTENDIEYMNDVKDEIISMSYKELLKLKVNRKIPLDILNQTNKVIKGVENEL